MKRYSSPMDKGYISLKFEQVFVDPCKKKEPVSLKQVHLPLALMDDPNNR